MNTTTTDQAAELMAVQAKIDAARAVLDAAEQAWLQARRRFGEVTRPLYQERESLLCNVEGDGGPQA
jgi:hypothetical protein